MASRVLLSFFLIAASGSLAADAQQAAEYQLKAEFLERFTRFIEWPSLAGDSGPFLIGVVGRNPFGAHLEQIAASRRVKGRRVEVVYFDDAAKIADCHVLFISSSEKERLQSILSLTRSKPILTVSDTSGFASAGVLINFYAAGESVRFEINEAAVERSGLRVSSKLFKLARLVGPEVR